MPKDSDAKELLKNWSMRFWDKTGEKYIPTWGRDVKMMTDILAIMPFEKVRNLVDYYYTTEQRIYSLPFFKAQLNELIQKYKQVNPTIKHHIVKDKYD